MCTMYTLKMCLKMFHDIVMAHPVLPHYTLVFRTQFINRMEGPRSNSLTPLPPMGTHFALLPVLLFDCQILLNLISKHRKIPLNESMLIQDLVLSEMVPQCNWKSTPLSKCHWDKHACVCRSRSHVFPFQFQYLDWITICINYPMNCITDIGHTLNVLNSRYAT